MDVAEVGRAQFLSDQNAEAEALSVPGDFKTKRESEGPPLGTYLATTREARHVTLDDAIKETRIPDHYLRMIENNDYSLISDQLYVLPFLRRYATFLGLDPEEIGMRFVREVQRADNAPAPRTLEPIEMDRADTRNLNRIAMVVAGVIGIVVMAWFVQSHRHGRQPAPLNAAMASTPH